MDDQFKNLDDGQFFARRPPDGEKSIGIPVLRAKTKGGCSGIVLSETPIGTWTHFYQGRTRPCIGPACAMCLDPNPKRWHSWVIVRDSVNGKLGIFELPANAALDLDDFCREHHSLRGWKLSLTRPSGKVNGRVFLAISGPKVDAKLLPPCPDLPKILLRMWQVRNSATIVDIFDEPKVWDGEDPEAGLQLA